MADSNYGSTFTKGAASIGKCIVVDFPELSTGKANITNHASGGKTEYIPTGLIEAGDITLSVLAEATTLSGMYTEMEAKTVSECVITNPVDTLTFDGFYQSIKVESADAQKPDVVKLTVVLAVTGGVTIS